MRSEMETIVACAAPYNLWNMVPWFIVKQMQIETVKFIMYQLPYCFAEELFRGSQSNKHGNYQPSRECFHGQLKQQTQTACKKARMRK